VPFPTIGYDVFNIGEITINAERLNAPPVPELPTGGLLAVGLLASLAVVRRPARSNHANDPACVREPGSGARAVTPAHADTRPSPLRSSPSRRA
jgi:hypothetical protein